MRAEILVGPEQRRRWSVAEKLRIVREAFKPGARVSDVARRRDVSRGQIDQWRAELRDGLWHDNLDETAATIRASSTLEVELAEFRAG